MPDTFDNQTGDGIDFQPLTQRQTTSPRPSPAPTAQARVNDGVDFRPSGASPAAGSPRGSSSGIDFEAPAESQSGAAQPRETISAYTPSLWERAKNALTAGIPRYSSRTASNPKYGQAQLISPEEAMTPGEQQRHPVLTGLGELAGGMTTPQNAAILAASGGLGSLPGAAGRIVPRLISGGFSAQMLWDAYRQYPEFKAALDRGDESEAWRIGTHIAGGVGMGLLAGRQALKGEANAPSATSEARQPIAALPAYREPIVTPAPQMPPVAPVPIGRPARIADWNAQGQPIYSSESLRPGEPQPARPVRGLLRPLNPAPGETIAGQPVNVRTFPGDQPLITPEPARTPEGAIRAPASSLGPLRALPPARGPEPDEATDFLAGKPSSVPTLRPLTAGGLVEQYRPGYKPSFAPTDSQIDFRPLSDQKPSAVQGTLTLTGRAEDARSTLKDLAAAESAKPSASQTPVSTAAPAERIEPMSTPAIAAKTAPVDRTAEMQRAANLTFGQLKRNPIEQQYARDVWSAMQNAERSPEPPQGMALARARSIQSKLASISSGEGLPSVLNPDPRISGQFAPDEIDAAHARLVEASSLLKQADKPGRYQTVEDAGGESERGGRWYGITSLRTMFPWFADMKESPAELARAIERQKGPAYNRLLQSAAEYEQSSREATRGIVRDLAPDLEQLVGQVKGIDPDLAQILTDAASGKLGVFDGSIDQVREWTERHIEDAKQLTALSSAVDELAEAERAEHSGPRGAEEGSRASGESRPDESVIPGFESAVGEQRRAAGQYQGEKLTEQINRPPESIEAAAGEMERTSPLFRGTEASPQREMFNPAARSERIKALREAIGQGETRLRSGVNGIGERLSEGELEAVRRSVENTRAELESLGGSIRKENAGDRGESTLYSGIDPTRAAAAVRILGQSWQDNVARPFIDRVLGVGDKYVKARESDPEVATGLHLLDNAPQYLRLKAAQQIHSIIGGLSREQERLFTLLADADSRENLSTNHSAEYRQALGDPAIQEALRKYRPLERELSATRARLGGDVLDQDYLRRVYEKYVPGIGKEQAPGSPERATSAFDRVIRPQRIGTMSREASAEYHYQNGLHEFGPAFATKFIGTNLRALRDTVAREFLSKAEQLAPGEPEPRSIEYNGEKYYRPDVAAEMGRGAKAYDRYDPTAGEKFPQPADGKFLGPREVVRALNDYGRRDDSGPGALRRFFQEQVIGFGFGAPHVANILRRVTQNAPGGALNPKAWASAWQVAFDKELRERGVKGLNDKTFDMLAQHGAITTGEMANLKEYIGGNLNPLNWARSMAQVGHKVLFEPGAAGGFGGIDQRARVYIADMMRSERPDLSDEQISSGVRDALGDYNRANWSDRQKLLGKFMLFPGWDASSIRWVIQHPLRTTVPGAVLTLLANQALHNAGGNRAEDQSDIDAIHVGDRTLSTGLLRESVARNLFRPFINYANAKVQGSNEQRAQAAAARGMTSGAGGLLGMLRPDLSGFIALAANRQNLFGGKELVSKDDYDAPGKILPTRALEKQAVFAVRHAVPALDRMLDAEQDLDLSAFVGGNLAVPNYREDTERRLFRNDAESQETFRTVSRLAKTDPELARQYMRDPDNAAYALFRRDFAQAVAALNRIDRAREEVQSSKMPADQKANRLRALDANRQTILGHAETLNNVLFQRRQQPSQTPQRSGLRPLGSAGPAPGSGSGLRPLVAPGAVSPSSGLQPLRSQ